MNKRNIKNIILIVIILLTMGSMVFTMYYAKNHITTNENSNMMQAPSMPNDNNNNNNNQNTTEDNSTSKDNTNQNNSTPPEKPDSDQNQSSTPPEKPGNEGDTDNEGDTNSNNGQPSMPNDNGSNDNNSNNMQGGTPPTMQNGQTNKSLTTWYYVFFIGESLILSIAIIYLVMSCCNKKTFKESFENKDKILIAILSIILLTSALTYADKFITTKYFLNNEQTSFNNNSNSNSNIAYSGSTTIKEDTTIEEGTYTSSNSDENAILVTSTASLSNISVNKTGDSDGGDSTSFYGTNSAITAKDGANLTLDNIEVVTNATGANGVFSYGGSATTNNSSSDGTTVTISNSTITTKKDNSGGIMTTGGGTMNANNLTITTSGTSSAAIRSDRGGGTVNVKKGTYTTTGKGSPAIYSTANIKVSDATLISKASEGVVIEGKNSVTLDNCTLTDTNSTLNGQSTTYKNIFLYQSMSGDASVGNSEFTAKNSTITTNKGDTLYATNTSATFNLENNTIINNDKTSYFLRAQSDSWGTDGQNGADVVLNLTNQSVSGNIYIDEISTLEMNLTNNSYYEGSINNKNTAEKISLTLDKTSKIKLTGDTYVTSLTNKDSSNSNIDFNGYKLYVNGKAIN